MPDYARRHARHGHVGRHIGQHDSMRGDLRAFSDMHIAQDTGPDGYQHAVAHLGMPIPDRLTRATKRDMVK